MSDPDVSTESSRLSSPAENCPTETQTGRQAPLPDEARAAAIRAKAIEILRRAPPEMDPEARGARPEVGDSGAEGRDQGLVVKVRLVVGAECARATQDGAEAGGAKSERGDNGSADAAEIVNRKSEIGNEVIPARMLNEFVYCPRLFYYEFV